MKKITIAIDGPAASGKSTIAKIIAKKLQYIYIDTGAMYRCVAYFLVQNNIDIRDENKIISVLSNIDIALDSENRVFLNSEEITDYIRSDEISLATSTVSSYLAVREFLVAKQRELASKGGTILDGRDIGTVVLPNAELKIYQIASSKTRAHRRYLENIKRGLEADEQKILEEIEQRDHQDMTRKHSPLKQADDAVCVDTSTLSIEEVVDTIIKLIEQRVEA